MAHPAWSRYALGSMQLATSGSISPCRVTLLVCVVNGTVKWICLCQVLLFSVSHVLRVGTFLTAKGVILSYFSPRRFVTQ